jgi:hypothetical protein
MCDLRFIRYITANGNCLTPGIENVPYRLIRGRFIGAKVDDNLRTLFRQPQTTFSSYSATTAGDQRGAFFELTHIRFSREGREFRICDRHSREF